MTAWILNMGTCGSYFWTLSGAAGAFLMERMAKGYTRVSRLFLIFRPLSSQAPVGSASGFQPATSDGIK